MQTGLLLAFAYIYILTRRDDWGRNFVRKEMILFNILNMVHWILTGYITRAGAAYPFGSPAFTTSFQMGSLVSLCFICVTLFSLLVFIWSLYCLSVFYFRPVIITLVSLSYYCTSFTSIINYQLMWKNESVFESLHLANRNDG